MEKGFKKRVITLWVETLTGDKWMNKEGLIWKPLKDEDGFVVEEDNTIK